MYIIKKMNTHTKYIHISHTHHITVCGCYLSNVVPMEILEQKNIYTIRRQICIYTQIRKEFVVWNFENLGHTSPLFYPKCFKKILVFLQDIIILSLWNCRTIQYIGLTMLPWQLTAILHTKTILNSRITSLWTDKSYLKENLTLRKTDCSKNS